MWIKVDRNKFDGTYELTYYEADLAAEEVASIIDHIKKIDPKVHVTDENEPWPSNLS